MVLPSADTLQKSFFLSSFFFFWGGGGSLHPEHFVQNVCKGYQQTTKSPKEGKAFRENLFNGVNTILHVFPVCLLNALLIFRK